MRMARPVAGVSASAEWLDVAGAATFFGLTPKSVCARVARRQLPFRRLGSRILFSRAELIEFLDKLGGCFVAEAIANATHESSQ